MDTKLSNRLFKKYKFLKKKSLPSGFECGDGWHSIIDNMCKQLRDNPMLPNDFVITKVFDKYGDLKVFSLHGNNTTRMIIEAAFDESMEICDACGGKKDDEGCPKCTVPVIDYSSSKEDDDESSDEQDEE